jgi:lysophospholipase
VQLVETVDNPMPPGPVLVEVVTDDGLALRAARWTPDGSGCRGTICILQGRAEFIEKYFEVIRELLGRGFAVLAFDWRGQGRSGRSVSNPRKGHVADFDLYRRDLEAVRAQLLETMPRPHFALAHSMGAAVALAGAHDGWLPFVRVVAVSPMIELCLIKAPHIARTTARLMRLLGLGKAFVPGGTGRSIASLPFPGNRLSGDPQRYARNVALVEAVGEAAIGSPTVAWMDAAFRIMACFRDPRFASAIRLPMLVLAAGADPVCAAPAIERFAARLKAGHAIVIPGARHEILMETDAVRAQFWAAFDAFIPGSGAGRASSPEQRESRLVDATIAGGDD